MEGSFVLVCDRHGGRILEATADWMIQCHQRHLMIMLGTESDPPITAGSARVVSAVLLALLDWLWSRSGWRCRRCCYCCSSAMGRVNSLLCVTYRVSFYAWIGRVAKLQILRFFATICATLVANSVKDAIKNAEISRSRAQYFA